jgi:hypothetical protein
MRPLSERLARLLAYQYAVRTSAAPIGLTVDRTWREFLPDALHVMDTVREAAADEHDHAAHLIEYAIERG